VLKVVEEYRGVTWSDYVTVPLEPGVAPCSRSSYHLFTGNM